METVTVRLSWDSFCGEQNFSYFRVWIFSTSPTHKGMQLYPLTLKKDKYRPQSAS